MLPWLCSFPDKEKWSLRSIFASKYFPLSVNNWGQSNLMFFHWLWMFCYILVTLSHLPDGLDWLISHYIPIFRILTYANQTLRTSSSHLSSLFSNYCNDYAWPHVLGQRGSIYVAISKDNTSRFGKPAGTKETIDEVVVFPETQFSAVRFWHVQWMKPLPQSPQSFSSQSKQW